MQIHLRFWSMLMVGLPLTMVCTSNYAWANEGNLDHKPPTNLIRFADFESDSAERWTAGRGENGGRGEASVSTQTVHEGDAAIAWHYDFRGFSSPEPGGVYTRLRPPQANESALPGRPLAIDLWVYGDGSGRNLGVRLRDAAGRIWQKGLGRVDWEGWKQINQPLLPDEDIASWGGDKDAPSNQYVLPVEFHELTLGKGVKDSPRIGTIYFDNLSFQLQLDPATSLRAQLVAPTPFGLSLDADPELVLRLNNVWPEPRQLQLTGTVRDYHGNEQTLSQHIAFSGPEQRDIDLPIVLPRRGYYEVDLTLKASGGDASEAAAKPTWSVRRTIGRLPKIPQAMAKRSPFGVNGAPRSAEMVRVFEQMGVSIFRSHIRWPRIEPAKDQYVWSGPDELVERTNNSPVLDFLFLTGSKRKPDWLDAELGSEAFTEAWVERIRTTAERYKGRVKYYDLWNEPDLTWPASKQDFARMCYRAYQVIKQIDPNATVIYPSTSGGDFRSDLEGFTIPSLKAFDGNFPFDVYATHPYSRPDPPEAINFREKFQRLSRWMAEHGDAKPIWANEVGFPTGTDRQSVSEAQQVAYMARLFTLSRTVDVDKIFWYQPFSGRDTDYSEMQYGFWHHDYSPKPSALTYAQCAYRLTDVAFDREISLGGRQRCYLFRGDEHAIAVFWSLEKPVAMSIDWPDGVILERVDGSAYDQAPSEFELGIAPYFAITDKERGDQLLSALDHAMISGGEIVSIRHAYHGDRYLLQVTNLVDRPVDVEAILRGLKPWGYPTPSGSSRQVTLGPGESESVWIEIDTPPMHHRGEVTVEGRTLDASTKKYEERSGLVVLPIPSKQDAVTNGDFRIDGDFDDWKVPPQVQLDEWNAIAPTDRAVHLWDNADDLSMSVWAAWNRAGLYLAIYVQDDEHGNSNRGARLFAADSIQLAADFSQPFTPSSYAASTTEWSLALTDAGANLHQYAGRQSVGREMVYAVKRDDAEDATRYEWFIPWTRFGVSGVKAGQVFSLNIIANDVDGKDPRYWVELAPGLGSGKSPDTFARAVLLPHSQ